MSVDGIFSTVTCSEEKDTRQETFTKTGVQCQVTLRTAYTNRYALVADIVGNRKTWPGTADVGDTSPRAFSASIAGDGYTGTLGQSYVYTDALVTVQYSTRENQQLFTEELQPSVEFLTLPFKRFRWRNDGSSGTGSSGNKSTPISEKEAPGEQRFSMVLARTLYQVPPDTVPAEVLSLIGSVNDAAYTSSLLGGLSFDEETLLFMPSQLSRTVDMTLNLCYNVSLKWAFQPQGWNKFRRAATDQFEYMYQIDDDGDLSTEPYRPYPKRDHSTLLT